jgi:hypothetical protein
MGDAGNKDKSVASAKSAKSIESTTKTMKLLQKDNCRLKKSVSALQKCDEGEDNNLSISSAKGSSHCQEAMEMLQESHLKIVLALKSNKSIGLDLRNVLLLDNQSTFGLCCNRKFVNLVRKAMHALATVVVSRSWNNASYLAISFWFGPVKKPSPTSYASRILTRSTGSHMTAKWTQLLLSITVRLVCLTFFLKCTLAGCMYATQRKWVSLGLSRL